MNRINLLGCLCDSLPHFNELHLSVSMCTAMYMSSTATCAHVKPLVYLASFVHFSLRTFLIAFCVLWLESTDL